MSRLSWWSNFYGRDWALQSGATSVRGVSLVKTDGSVIASPVTLAELKSHLRTDATDTSEDASLAIMNAAAAELVESFTGRALVEAQYTQRMDGFPDGAGIFELRRNPVKQLDEFKSTDDDGVDSVVDPTTYRLNLDHVPAQVCLKFGAVWPVVVTAPGRVSVKFTAGYAANKCPACARQAVLLLAGHFYEHRESGAAGPEYDQLWKGLAQILAPIWIPAL